jgi:hypothetical protein
MTAAYRLFMPPSDFQNQFGPSPLSQNIWDPTRTNIHLKVQKNRLSSRLSTINALLPRMFEFESSKFIGKNGFQWTLDSSESSTENAWPVSFTIQRLFKFFLRRTVRPPLDLLIAHWCLSKYGTK